MTDFFELKYCKSCLTPNTRPKGVFNSDGICSACEYYSSFSEVDFDARFFELKGIIAERTKHLANKRWNSIVGVSGGKDSTRQALWARDKLGLRPLLVNVAYPHRQMTQVGAENLANLVALGFDCITVSPAPLLSRDLVKTSFEKFGNFFKATEMVLFAAVPQIAIEKGIDLVLWGENGALQVGDQGVMGKTIWDGNYLRNSNTLEGGELGWFLDVAGREDRLGPYKFPEIKDLQSHKVNTVFMGPAWSDWSNTSNSQIAILNGFSPRLEIAEGTADAYGTENIDEDWGIVNNLLKYYKFGFSKGTEQANSLIREGIITRTEGVQIASRFDPDCSEAYIKSFCEYIDVPTSFFWDVAYKFCNPALFDKSKAVPKPKFTPGTDAKFSI